MPFSGTGIFTRVYQWTNDAVNGIFVDATRTDTDSNDIAAGLTNCVTRDGQSPATANLPLGGFKLTGMGNGAANTDSVNYGQVFNSPAFITPTATTTPAPGNNSLLLATTSFVATSFAPLASPALTGIPTVPTAAPGTNNTQAASTAFATALAFSSALPAASLGLVAYDGVSTAFTKSLAFGLNYAKAANVASAATPDIWSGNGNTMHITGTTALTGFTAAPQAGAWRELYFDGACLLTNGANFNVQGGVDYTTMAGDIIRVYADTTTKFYLFIQPADGFAQNLLCTSTLTKTSDTALANIPGFTATLAAGKTYRFSAEVFGSSISTGGVKFGFNGGTATATSFVATAQLSEAGGLYSTLIASAIGTTIADTNAVGKITTINGTIVCNAGGTFIMQFAQNASDVTPSIVLANSTFTVERIS